MPTPDYLRMIEKTADDKASTPYRAEVQELYTRLDIVPTDHSADFRCATCEECKESLHLSAEGVFNTGSWPYVGSEYGQAVIGGRSRRILFVGMERGGADEPTDFNDTQQMFRYFTTHPNRNNKHLRGVKKIVDALLGPDGDPRYVRFALTNAVKCCKISEYQKSESTPIMIDNCQRHLSGELEVLKPHLIITQGDDPRYTIRKILAEWSIVKEWNEPNSHAAVLETPAYIVLETRHPSYTNWGGGDDVSLPETLREAIEETRSALGRRAT